ncbi:hypothetical protein [Hymenobacter rubripertinctus]|uniref:Uncharacterized protein n=1 Tax=Hymenobacter rubripertinctus TaxID=2029981 RepID=A0A418QP00_9BACT|nr:hypothetical protein [Hymenobacter rubripertinctus]RIY06945.1 hypothetical protein D0T11_17645 [Hymenobacter rubripertinctus]
MIVELEFPDDDAVFMMELIERMPGVRILPPTTEPEAAKRERVAAFRKQLYHSHNQPDPLQSEGK